MTKARLPPHRRANRFEPLGTNTIFHFAQEQPLEHTHCTHCTRSRSVYQVGQREVSESTLGFAGRWNEMT